MQLVVAEHNLRRNNEVSQPPVPPTSLNFVPRKGREQAEVAKPTQSSTIFLRWSKMVASKGGCHANMITMPSSTTLLIRDGSSYRSCEHLVLDLKSVQLLLNARLTYYRVGGNRDRQSLSFCLTSASWKSTMVHTFISEELIIVIVECRSDYGRQLS